MGLLTKHTKALKLDSSYRPLEIIDSIEALVLCLIGKAYAIESHSAEIHSVTDNFKIPAVIVLSRYIRFRFNTLSCKRSNILWRDQNQCQYCGNRFNDEMLTMDHVVPRCRGGKNTWLNLVTACRKCNQKKGSKRLDESGMKLIRKPYKPKMDLLKTLEKEEISYLWDDYLWSIHK
jgi:5-methylcytosine-specific restriction endonuclease McrA